MSAKKNRYLNQAGFTLIETMVAIAVLAIGIMAMISFISAQQRETRALVENLDKIDLHTLIESTLSDGTVCTFEVQSTPLTFNPALIQSNPSPGANQNPTFYMSKIHSSDDANSKPVLVTGGSYGSNSTLKVASIVLNIIGAEADPDKFIGEFVVTFNPANMVRQLKPIKIKTTIITDKLSVAPNKKIIGCLTPETVATATTAPPMVITCPVLPPPPLAPVAVPVGGDCRSFGCPATSPYLSGCDLTALGSKGYFLVRYTKGAPSSTYLQEGGNCGKGGFTGNLYCSSVDTGPVSVTNCPVRLGRGLSSTTYVNQ